MMKGVAAGFDRELVQRAGAALELGSSLKGWLEAESTAEKRELAGAATREAVESEFRQIGVVGDGAKLFRLTEDMKYFEDLIIGARSGLGGKFYRDHLNHQLRVFILEMVLAQELAEVLVGDGGGFGLEGLLHDVGYPLQSVRSVVEELVRGVRRTYGKQYLSWANVSGRGFAVVEPLVDADVLPEFDLRTLLREAEALNHGLVGACGVLGLCSRTDQRNLRVRDVCRAIAGHDSGMNVGISMAASGRSAILVLADELQEWGRPAGYETEAVVPRLGRLEVAGRRVECEYTLDVPGAGYAGCSAEAKYRNLSRIDLSGLMSVAVRIELPKYRNVLEDCIAMPNAAGEEFWTKEWRRRMEVAGDNQGDGWSLKNVWCDPNVTEIVVCRGDVPRAITIRSGNNMWDILGDNGSVYRFRRGKADELSRRTMAWIEQSDDYWGTVEEGIRGLGCGDATGWKASLLEGREYLRRLRRVVGGNAWIEVSK